jgi:hypothetical protein
LTPRFLSRNLIESSRRGQSVERDEPKLWSNSVKTLAGPSAFQDSSAAASSPDAPPDVPPPKPFNDKAARSATE